MTDLSAEFQAGLAASIGTLAGELREERQRKIALAQDVAYVEAPAIVGGAVPLNQAGWGPNTSYVWAIQRITVAGLGATTDLVTAYRGTTPVAASAPQNALFSFAIPAAGAVATWHPGRTGLILQPEESLVFGGTFTGTTLAVSVDVIQLHVSKLPYFLL
jgi:hypothetical protein